MPVPYQRATKPCECYDSCQEPEQPTSVCVHCGHLRSDHETACTTFTFNHPPQETESALQSKAFAWLFRNSRMPRLEVARDPDEQRFCFVSVETMTDHTHETVEAFLVGYFAD